MNTSAARLLRVCLVSVFVLAALGVKTQPARSLMAGTGLTWTVWNSAPVRLVVCWEQPSDANPLPGETDQTSGALRREWVRLAVKNNWERYSRVIFVGWQQCQDEANAVSPPHTLGPRRPGTLDENLKVKITYSGASNNWGHGSWGDYQKEGLSLNLHCAGPGQPLKECIESLSIHEFGHTLGYYHEEERIDWPNNIPGCPRQTYPPSDPWWPVPGEHRYGAPDPASVMAYCSGGPTSLSPRDVGGVQRSYMRRNPGTLLSVPGSLCLSAHAANPNGDSAFGWECDEANNDQEWLYDQVKASLSITTTGQQPVKRCLDVDTAGGSKVQTWDCHYGANQQWSFRRVEVRGYGGLCLTRPTGTANGAVNMQACTSSAEQLWDLLPGTTAGAFMVRSSSGNKCLVASVAGGTAVSVDTCILGPKVYLPAVQNGAAAQPPPPAVAPKTREFTLLAGGQIGVPTTGQTAYCMDVVDVWDADYTAGLGGPQAGQAVQVFGCYGAQLNQKWNLSGDVTSGGKCLQVTGDRVTNGVAATMAACNNTSAQDWDYYW